MEHLQSACNSHSKLTVREIAKRLGVAPSTVSRALDDHPRISSNTKALVRRALAEMQKETEPAEFSTIGLFLLNDEGDDFFASIVRGAMNYADKMGIYLLLEKIDSRQDFLPYAIARRRVDGAIIAGIPIADELVKKLAAQDIPVTFIGRYLSKKESTRLNTVLSDNNLGGRLAGEHLLEKGYQKFVIVTHPGPQYNPQKDRAEGFIEAIGHQDFVQYVTAAIEGRQMVGEPVDTILSLVREGYRVGVFAVSDHLARALILALNERGIPIPEAVGIIGYDGVEKPDANLVPSLTTLNVPKEELGYMAGRLIRDIALKQVPTPIQVCIQPQLIVRGSTERSVYLD